jgi:hypothetical protein
LLNFSEEWVEKESHNQVSLFSIFLILMHFLSIQPRRVPRL